MVDGAKWGVYLGEKHSSVGLVVFFGLEDEYLAVFRESNRLSEDVFAFAVV